MKSSDLTESGRDGGSACACLPAKPPLSLRMNGDACVSLRIPYAVLLTIERSAVFEKSGAAAVAAVALDVFCLGECSRTISRTFSCASMV